MNKAIVILFGICILKAANGLSDDDTRVFMVAYMNITTDNSQLPQFQSLHVSASIDARYRVTVPSIAVDEYADLHPNSIINPQFSQVTWEVDLTKEHNTETNFNSIRVVSNNKIDLFGYKATRGSTDGFLGLPLTANSTEFFIPSFINVPEGHSSFLVVSPYKDACVEASFVNGANPRRIFFRALNEFEVFQTYSQDEDYTGILVSSTRPVAVFGGHECAQVPENVVYCDHLIEQIPPVSEWGRVFIVGPIIGRDRRAGYIIRVLTSQVTGIEIANEMEAIFETVTRGMGDYYQYIAPDSRMLLRIKCTVPCLVVQYNTGYFQATGAAETVPTDPFMTIIVPVNHFTNFMSFGTARYWYNSATEPFANFLTIVAKTAELSGVRLNNAQVTQSWTQMQGTGYSVTSFAIPAGNFTLYHTNTAARFVGYVYGHSQHEPTAYGYPVGYDIQGPPIPGYWWDEFFTEAPTTAATCTNTRDMPPASLRGPDQMFQARSFLKYQAASADCYFKFQQVLQLKAGNMEDLLNQLICSRTICPNTEYAQVNSLSIVAYNPMESTTEMVSFDADIELITSIDESIGDILRCKRAIIAFLQQPINWNMPTPVINCPDVDLNDVILIAEQFNCPAPTK